MMSEVRLGSRGDSYYEYLLNQTNEELPQVISNSYGDDEQTVPPEYAKHVCDLIGMGSNVDYVGL